MQGGVSPEWIDIRKKWAKHGCGLSDYEYYFSANKNFLQLIRQQTIVIFFSFVNC